MQLILDRTVPLNRNTLAALFLVELLILWTGVTFSPHQLPWVPMALVGVLFLLILPVYPQLLFPLMILSTVMDQTGALLANTGFFKKYELGLTGFHFTAGSAFLFFALYLLFKRRTRLPRLELTLPLVLFLIANGLSVLYAPEKVSSAVYFLRLILLSAFLFLTAYMVDSKWSLTLVIASVVICSIGTGILGISQTLTTEFFLPANVIQEIGASVPRAAATYHNPNDFAASLMVPVVLLSAFLINLKMALWKRLVLGLLTSVLIAALLTTFSRSNWLAAGMGILCVAFFTKKLRILFIALIVTLIILAGISLISHDFAELVFGRFVSIFKVISEFRSSLHISGASRVLLVVAAFAMFLDHPVFGIGARGFPILFPEYRPPQYPVWLPVKESHTLPTTILAELGIVGFAIAAWLLVVILRTGVRAIREVDDPYLKTSAIGLFSVFVAFQFNLLFTGAIMDNYLWMMTGMLFAVRGIERARRAP